MTHLTSKRTLTRTLVLTATAGALAFGAANAYAADEGENVLVSQTDQSQTWIYDKAAVTPDAAIIVPEELPEELPEDGVLVPLDTTLVEATPRAVRVEDEPSFDSSLNLAQFDLVEDEPVFIGARGADEFDTRDAQIGSGSYPDSMDVDPFFTVAGAGLATDF